ncbi:MULTISPECIES: site-2 protease family protein [Candidatus Nitrosocaldus]|jgi:membrane-associated protease RseP (regulator of RpoE activity)|uniref:Putative peptidase M50 n=1 Tax=Candidatus Nitrosocaldus cavascurensis TaxID=2058097 RepID=A0A2K5ANL1_9ARCH|nr:MULTISPECIES: site-2 protease family protein [Candidatus Nitrosocaldus]GBC74200.1 Periplasmic pH-dependent serine endoprotease DegQ [archaeon HR05]SPC33231.1 putative peptidase M50 [Candidatus Nitrosocaldus cavascurensis]
MVFGDNTSIVALLLAWVIIIASAKALRLEKRGFEIKPFMLTYKNHAVSSTLDRLLAINRSAVRAFADVSIVAGAIMMVFAVWFLLNNLIHFFADSGKFSEVTLLIPGVTIRSVPNLVYFLLAAPIVLVVHEVAHGIVARLERIKVKSGGFAIIIALIAGFVEPDEDEFNRARRVSKVRVIAAGSTSNILLSFLVASLLMFNPAFGNILELLSPQVRSIFYNDPLGVPVVQVIEGSGAAQAGMRAGDIITAINDTQVKTPADLARVKLVPGEQVSVSILRDGEPMRLTVTVMGAEDDPNRGMIGIIRDVFPYMPPKVPFWIPWPHEVFMFLLWLWMLSFFIGIFNMLPMIPLDGEKYVSSMLEKRVSARSLKATRIGINALGFGLLGANIIATVIKSGFITI